MGGHSRKGRNNVRSPELRRRTLLPTICQHFEWGRVFGELVSSAIRLCLRRKLVSDLQVLCSDLIENRFCGGRNKIRRIGVGHGVARKFHRGMGRLRRTLLWKEHWSYFMLEL